MLTVHAHKEPNATIDYFLLDESADQVGPGLWVGKTIALLGEGIGKEVDAEGFERLLSGEMLPTVSAGRVAASDFAFTAPKSVSILAAIADDRTRDNIIAAHLSAVHKGLREIEKLACVQVTESTAKGLTPARGRGRPRKDEAEEREKKKKDKDKKVRLITGNMASALFTHFCARPVDGEPDPNLHTHCVTPRITFREDKVWATLAIDIREPLREINRIYTQSLLDKLLGLGIPAARSPVLDISIDGVTTSLLGTFSRRSKQINAEADALEPDGTATPRQRRAIAENFREPKSDIPWPEWIPAWRSRALEVIAQKELQQARIVSATPHGQSVWNLIEQFISESHIKNQDALKKTATQHLFGLGEP